MEHDEILTSFCERILEYATLRVSGDHAEDLVQDVPAALHDKYSHVTKLTDLVSLAFQVLRILDAGLPSQVSSRTHSPLWPSFWNPLRISCGIEEAVLSVRQDGLSISSLPCILPKRAQSNCLDATAWSGMVSIAPRSRYPSMHPTTSSGHSTKR